MLNEILTYLPKVPLALATIGPSLLVALLVGAAIGLERSREGRAAGFRTFTLVALGSALTVAPAVHPSLWHYLVPVGLPPMDPTRVIQGIVTGVGFLGAGVIYKEGFNVRGLTSAASIWVTSALGVMAGLGLFSVALAGAFGVIVVLSLFRKIESRMPTRVYSHLTVGFELNQAVPEKELRAMLKAHGFQIRDNSYKMSRKDNLLEFKMTLVSASKQEVKELSQALVGNPAIVSFRMTTGND